MTADVRTEVAALLQLFGDVVGSPDRETAAPLVDALLGDDDLHVGPAYEWMTTTCSMD
jgi:hypothetical protein